MALIATMPTVGLAEGVAASLSASFGNSGNGQVVVDTSQIIAPTSVSAAGAAGGFAVASSVATAFSSGAASGATDNADLPPTAVVTYNGAENAYETTVSFAPSAATLADIAADAAEAAIDDLCAAGFAVAQDPISASQAASTGVLLDETVLASVPFVGLTDLGGEVADTTVSITNGAITITGGGVTVNCSN
jgi:hypothetical protein